jgi:hypothetical protein
MNVLILFVFFNELSKTPFYVNNLVPYELLSFFRIHQKYFYSKIFDFSIFFWFSSDFNKRGWKGNIKMIIIILKINMLIFDDIFVFYSISVFCLKSMVKEFFPEKNIKIIVSNTRFIKFRFSIFEKENKICI